MKYLFILFVLFTLSACEKPLSNTSHYQWPLRKGFPLPHTPLDNPMSNAKIALGRSLFYDKNLSANKTQSCATCHQQQFAFTEPLTTSIGSTGQQHRRNSLPLINIAYNTTLTWAHDGLNTIEQQLLLPMFGEEPLELGITGHEKEVLSRFQTKQYKSLFAAAFPHEKLPNKIFSNERISFDLIVKSLASFVRSLISFNSPFDRYAYEQDDSALSDAAIRGMILFFSEKFECHHCHGGFNFTQSSVHKKQSADSRPFHNTGLYNISSSGSYPTNDTGLAEISLNPKDNGRFRAPTLRNIALTAPYMHDGSIATLDEVIDFYAAGGRNIKAGQYAGDGRQNPHKNPLVGGFQLTQQDKIDLVEFLNSLTDKQFLNNPLHAKP